MPLETGICPFFGWENGISCSVNGIHQQKTQIENGMGLRFEQGRHCDNGICAVGFSPNLDREMGIRSPLQDPF